VETFQLNFPEIPVYHGDITKLSVEECLRLSGVQPGQLDVLDGSPPCQGFSTAGKRNIDDDRNQLFREYVRLLRGLQPKAFVMENVSGMVKGKMKLVFVEILKELKASGYRVSARLLNAMYFNVPQSRQRMIFIGTREDLGIEPSHPKAESRPVTVREAMMGCVVEEEQRQTLLKAGTNNRSYDIWDRLQPGGNGRFGDHYRINPTKPCRTLGKFAANVGARSTMHWSEKRRMTTEEYKRCGGIPDDMHFPDWSTAVNTIGNSVPPLFMRAIAGHVRRLLAPE
jgi:DNA (cytosine-5)-methyltransferase 1